MSYDVLLLSDNVDAASLWIPVLTQANVAVTIAVLSDDKYLGIRETYSLVILDIYSAVAHVFVTVRHIRATSTVPILLLTPASSEPYILGAYKAGVTDCVTKPISPALFLAKVEALLHITQNEILGPSGVLQLGDLCLNTDRQVVTFTDGREIKLTRLECRLLALWMRNAGRVVETNTIIESVWDYDDGDSTILKNLVYRLRKKIEPDPRQPRYIVWTGDVYAFFPQSEDS